VAGAGPSKHEFLAALSADPRMTGVLSPRGGQTAPGPDGVTGPAETTLAETGLAGERPGLLRGWRTLRDLTP
jgi:hypothetical protein